MTTADDALLNLLHVLKARGYQFVTVTPSTHGRVLQRRDLQQAQCLEDVLGWNLPFEVGLIDQEILSHLRKADAIEQQGSLWRSRIRVSRLHDCLFLHSAFPTSAQNAAFFGPDSYRFADLVTIELSRRDPPSGGLIVDIGTGVGVGAVVAGQSYPDTKIAMTEINACALRFARTNANAAGVSAMALHTEQLEGIEGAIDIALANPPYMIDDRHRLYRDGGGHLGSEVTLKMASFTLPRLARGGRLILYSGSAICSGRDSMKEGLHTLADAWGCSLRYRELDPDVFGEELEFPQYARVDRIALIAAIFERN